MADKIDREGSFRARIVEYELKEFESGAVAIDVKCVLTQEPGSEGWVDLEEPLEASGLIFVIKKDGSVNTNGFDSLRNHAGWDGNLESIGCRTWEPTQCTVEIKREEYKDQIRYDVSFINAYEQRPKMSPARASELQAKYALKLQRAGGAIKPKTGKLAPPPPQGSEDDPEIPFSWLLPFIITAASLLS